MIDKAIRALAWISRRNIPLVSSLAFAYGAQWEIDRHEARLDALDLAHHLTRRTR